VPGLPDINPQTWQEVVVVICRGSPQDCRGEADKKAGASVVIRMPPGNPFGRLSLRFRFAWYVMCLHLSHRYPRHRVGVPVPGAGVGVRVARGRSGGRNGRAD
jgi:hypothetical protein